MRPARFTGKTGFPRAPPRQDDARPANRGSRRASSAPPCLGALSSDEGATAPGQRSRQDPLGVTMRELLDGELAPVTWEIGFLEAETAEAVERFAAWWKAP